MRNEERGNNIVGNELNTDVQGAKDYEQYDVCGCQVSGIYSPDDFPIEDLAAIQIYLDQMIEKLCSNYQPREQSFGNDHPL